MRERWRAREIVPAALGVGAIGPLTLMAQRYSPGSRDLDAGGIALIIVAAAVLLLRRRRPVLTLAVTSVAVAGYLAVGYHIGPILAAFFLGIYSVGRHCRLRIAAIAAAGGLLVLASSALVRDSVTPSLSGLGFLGAWTALWLAIGVAVRQRGRAVQRDRAAEVQALVDTERLRLSRDVHDVVGHGLAAINLQASVALRAAGRDDERGRARVQEALSAIETTSSAALDELRSVLAGMPTTPGTSLAPSPGLDGLADLVERISTPTRPVRLHVEKAPAALPGAADLAAYRVAQEALTNAVRHGTGEVDVTLAQTEGAVRLTVSNAVGPDSDDGTERTGMGLPGMQDRLAAVDGTLTTSVADGRFWLVATIPTPEAP
ncbi:sensor histidine kinase [Ruania alba]|uniref:histidine kinase n=1 Tax=Ruania alba TaxID=648782 RepID=A0A1H5LUW4_9MICO|nr:histidine kinase [Ruania alba]SEE80895.1 Signal transduction histidine kinase [Ruania alba]